MFEKIAFESSKFVRPNHKLLPRDLQKAVTLIFPKGSQLTDHANAIGTNAVTKLVPFRIIPVPENVEYKGILKDRYAKIKQIGKSQGTKIKIAWDLHTGEYVAIKRLENTHRNCLEIEKEYMSLLKVNHINVIQTFDRGIERYVPKENP